MESVESICSRFCTGAHEPAPFRAKPMRFWPSAMNRIGGQEQQWRKGGEDSARFRALEDVDAGGHFRHGLRRFGGCATGKDTGLLSDQGRCLRRFGGTPATYAVGGSLRSGGPGGQSPAKAASFPARRWTPYIAGTANASLAVGLISPTPAPRNIYSIEDLAQLIPRLQPGSPRAKVSVKLVAEIGIAPCRRCGQCNGRVIQISATMGGPAPRRSVRSKHAAQPVGAEGSPKCTAGAGQWSA